MILKNFTLSLKEDEDRAYFGLKKEYGNGFVFDNDIPIPKRYQTEVFGWLKTLLERARDFEREQVD